MYYALKDRDGLCEIETSKSKNELEEMIVKFEKEDVENHNYVEDYYYIEKVYDDIDIKIINAWVTFKINELYSGYRICDINTYKAYEDDELFSRILLVDKKHLIVLVSISITVDNELGITNFEVINKDYCL